MTKAESRGGGGGKLSRSETVTVRLDPKLRYLAELASRIHRRTLSSYIEWAIKTSVEQEPIGPGNHPTTIGDEVERLWDVDEADRFAKLALTFPQLLTHEEQVRWKLVRECGYFWKGAFKGLRREWTWEIEERSLLVDRVREHWGAVCEAAESGAGAKRLPQWERADQSPAGDFDDDVPF